MDMRLPAGVGPAAGAGTQQHPPLRLLQRWQPQPAAMPAALASERSRLTTWRACLHQFFAR
ncbi:hypothetical protein [Aquabacterium sp.]|uniref:hypothetical protein n=1 Tax=Aquabacterium sp. TaxID=1872578 RepID=UPI002CB800D9|nr:hypothetical protein [Aquabacterium sp.]HSW03434.1 hypothetical protein [Aquabacterium sp.]